MNSPVRHVCRPALSALAISLSATSYAAGPGVDAGSLLHQNEQELNSRKSAPPAIQTAPARPGAKASEGEATLQVNGFKFTGNTLLTSAALTQALSEFANRQLTLTQLKEAADVVASAYRKAGWTAYAYLPKQEIQGGIVTIQIVEARFGGAQLQGPAPARVNPKKLVEMAEANLVKGQPLHVDRIDRTLLLLDDLTGIGVTGNLIAGTQDGETNLALTAVDDALVTGNLGIDNLGSRATGPERINVNLSVNSPARIGDVLLVNGLKSEGSDYARISYSIPVGFYGWRIGLHASNLNYRVIADEFSSLDPYGTATTAGLDIAYPLLRSQTQNINVALSYDDKHFENTSNSVTSAYAIQSCTASLNAIRLDGWRGGGSINAGISATTGTSTSSQYAKLNLTLSRLQSLGRDVSLFAAISTQHANQNLDSSEKIYLGGSSGIRAYPASEAGGSEGGIITLEIRKSFERNFTLSSFYDYGRIKVNHDNSVASPADPNNYALKGYGVSLTWQSTPGVDVKLTAAQRIGTNPGALASGTDADGTKKMTRVWLSTSITF